jgi:AcrR family transcriptional regulator
MPRNGRNTRQQILDAAERLIKEGGFTRLTTSAVAHEAGCAEGTIFRYFKRKEDLCLAVVLENAPKFKHTIAGKRAGKGSVRNNLENIALAAIRFSDDLIPLGASLFADAKLLGRYRQAWSESERGPKEAFDLIAAYISKEQQLGRIKRKVEPLLVSALLLGSCFHRAFIRQGMGKNVLPMSDREFAAGIISTLMLGLDAEGAP